MKCKADAAGREERIVLLKRMDLENTAADMTEGKQVRVILIVCSTSTPACPC